LFSESDVAAIAELRPKEVAISLYGADAFGHDAVTGSRGSYDRTIASIKALRDLDVPVRISSVLMAETIDGFVPLRDLAESLGCDFRFDPTVTPREDGSLDVLRHRVGIDELRAFYLDEVVLPRSREGAVVTHGPSPAQDRATKVTGNCSAGFTTATIEAGGDVVPCPGFHPSFGSVASRRFADVWQGTAAETHRERMDAPLHECVQCDLLPYCTVRCPKLAQLEGKDLSDRFDRACELAAMVKDMRERWLVSAGRSG